MVTKKDQTLRSLVDMREENKNLTKAVSNPKDSRITTQTQRVSTCNLSGLEYGILAHQTYSPCLKHLQGHVTMGKV
jgi:hypothetical protein